MTAVTVRPATPADHPAIALLTAAAFRADRQVTPGHPYERPLTDVAGRAGAGELLVAVASERSSEASDAVRFTASERSSEASDAVRFTASERSNEASDAVRFTASDRSSEASDAAGCTDATTGKVVGSVLFVLAGSRYAELAGPGEAEFRMLAVDPAAQRRGVGEALARACLDRAGQLGYRVVRIYTRDFAKTAHRLYERLGFVRTPERDWSPRRGVDLYALRLDLPEPAESGSGDPT